MRSFSPALVVMLAGVALFLGAGVMLVTAAPLPSEARVVAPRAVVITPAPATAVPISHPVSVALFAGPRRGGEAR